MPLTIPLLNTYISSTSYFKAAAQIITWASNAESRYVCCANVHMLMEAYDSPSFRQVVNAADLVTPDGMPLVWLMRMRGIKNQGRVYGPTLMLKVLEAAASKEIPVGFFGGKTEVLEKLVSRMNSLYPKLLIAYKLSPMFTEITENEDNEIINQINASGVRILFVGLGCPKQEKWMHAHRGQIPAVMIGVGAAFDFHSGNKKQAPKWMQRFGLEWFFRLLNEPRRLWKRYLFHNTRFVILSLVEQIRFWFGKKS